MSAQVVFCTAPDEETGAQIARRLVEERLAACINVVPGLRSFYWWEGRVQDEREVLLVIKTWSDRVQELYERLPELHPYTVPEGIGWPVATGLTPYLQWVEGETRGADSQPPASGDS